MCNNQYDNEPRDSFFDNKELVNLIDTLNKDLRTTVSMYINGCTYSDISEQLALPPTTIKNRLQLAKAKLKPLLQKES